MILIPESGCDVVKLHGHLGNAGIQLFAATLEAQDPRRKELIAHALDDLTRLCDRAKEHS